MHEGNLEGFFQKLIKIARATCSQFISYKNGIWSENPLKFLIGICQKYKERSRKEKSNS